MVGDEGRPTPKLSRRAFAEMAAAFSSQLRYLRADFSFLPLLPRALPLYLLPLLPSSLALSTPVKYLSPHTNLLILRVSREHYRTLRAALTLLRRVGGHEVIARVLHVGGESTTEGQG